ncbi:MULTISPECIES: hypothetical protein [unclassified Endozoicomonas]|uniref:hypothetical protein n=1 Tax=unclassified Endozoicomonas TaxID=2644528 RepID=UPI003BB7E372
MKKLIAIAAMTLSMHVFADSIRTADGISCSFDADDSPWSVETYAEMGNDDYDNQYERGHNNSVRDNNKFGVKLVYKFGGPGRLQCNDLYQLELRDKEARVKQLEAKLKMYEKASNLAWD